MTSMALTALRRLTQHHGVCLAEVGQLDVGCTMLLDRSKSLKTELNAVLAQKSADPRLPVDRVPLIRAIIQLISSGASPPG